MDNLYHIVDITVRCYVEAHADLNSVVDELDIHVECPDSYGRELVADTCLINARVQRQIG